MNPRVQSSPSSLEPLSKAASPSSSPALSHLLLQKLVLWTESRMVSPFTLCLPNLGRRRELRKGIKGKMNCMAEKGRRKSVHKQEESISMGGVRWRFGEQHAKQQRRAGKGKGQLAPGLRHCRGLNWSCFLL